MRYYSLNEYCKKAFGEKLYKLSLTSSLTCPNRDGTLGFGGCIFCCGGSGDFASDLADVDTQIENAKRLIKSKTRGNRFIAYFQSFTSTYAPIERLNDLFLNAVKRDDIAVLSVATRPDCLSDSVMELLTECRKIKPVWVELGLQTMHEDTAKLINRGYPLSVFEDAVRRLKDAGIKVIVHMIIGLPRETEEMIVETARYIGNVGADGVKLQLLHVLKNTSLAEMYEKGEVTPLSLEKYTDILEECIRVIPRDTVIHRITGDGNKRLLIAPLWSGDKKTVLNYINRRFNEDDVIQGSKK